MCCLLLVFKSFELIGKKCTKIERKVLEDISDLQNPVVH